MPMFMNVLSAILLVSVVFVILRRVWVCLCAVGVGEDASPDSVVGATPLSVDSGYTPSSSSASSASSLSNPTSAAGEPVQ